VWEYGRKNEDRGSKIEWVSIRLAMLDHPSSILKPSPTLRHAHTLEKDLYFSGRALLFLVHRTAEGKILQIKEKWSVLYR